MVEILVGLFGHARKSKEGSTSKTQFLLASAMAKLLTSLETPVRNLALAAVKAAANAYAPYSRFGVGAALQHEDGTITVGSNCENAVYQSCCAERCAIVSANAKGYRRATMIAVYGHPMGKPVNTSDVNVCTPCGICRQMLEEVAELSKRPEFPVVLVSNSARHALVVPLSTLLPTPFGPKDLGLDLSEWNHGAAEKPLMVAAKAAVGGAAGSSSSKNQRKESTKTALKKQAKKVQTK